MSPSPEKSITHFTHPGHQLTATDGGHDQQYRCNGCKTHGTGKRFRCHGCDFDLHEYCGTCPQTFSSTMHRHPLTLVIRKAQSACQVTRFCDLCSDPVEGLFYTCKECEFDVHPICTQFPNELQHALHKIHPLKLESNSLLGFCAVCKNLCKGWRYRCRGCNFDIHLECIPIVQCPKNVQTTQRGIPVYDQGIPFQPPPQYSGYYAHGFPYGHGHGHGHGPGYNMYGYGYGHGHGHGHGPGYNMYGYDYGHGHGPGYNMYGYGYGYGHGHGPGPSYNMYNGQMHGHPVYPNHFVQQNQMAAGGAANNQGGNRLGEMVFSLVGQLGFGVLSNMIFGVDLTSVFA